jgi:hypothetical protein
MAFPNALVATELAAVNQILGAVGQAPVTTLDQTNPDVAIAYDTLQEVNREVQAEGWVFNTENEYPFTPDTNGQILIPDNVLLLDLSDLYENRGIDVVRRDGKLYNKTDHTYTWTDQVKCDVVWLFDFNDLPTPFRDLVTTRAAVQASTKMIGDSTVFQMLQQKEAMARANAMEYECNQGDYSYFGFPRSKNFYTSYQPFHTLAR